MSIESNSGSMISDAGRIVKGMVEREKEGRVWLVNVYKFPYAFQPKFATSKPQPKNEMPEEVIPTTQDQSLISELLTPGSSRHKHWLLILDLAFGVLLSVFLGLLWVTKGNKHIFGLIFIEGCLYASIKW